jgi:23S rRNA pseudouridine1911/1915/1917 synthase
VDDVHLAILYDDADLLVVDKPAGMVVHPTYKHTAGTLLDALRACAADWPASYNPTIVGRLDRGTSGIVIVAKHARAHAALQRVAIEKVYLAVVVGDVGVACGEIDLPLRVDPGDRRRVVVSPTGGRPSVTRFERLATRGGLSLLRCRLVTGRRHQIRAHLAARGWPIVGDAVYGEPCRLDDVTALVRTFPRQALHAWRVAFAHPFSGEPIAIEAPVPADLRHLLDAVNLSETSARVAPES